MSIMTVSGSIDVKELGRTYIHEHLIIDLSGRKDDPDARLDDLEAVTGEMKILKTKGIYTIVEVTNRGMGRDAGAMKRIADASGIKVIAGTGFYKEPYLPDYAYDMEIDALVALLKADILDGMDGSDIKAHVIGEVGTGKDAIAPMEFKLLHVAARTHLETGRPVSTHTTLGRLALEQLALFESYGVDPSKLVIGHLDLNCDPDYHLRVADTGCFMAFDTVGKLNYQSDEKRIESIKRLIDHGHLDQIVLSQDVTRKSHLAVNGGNGYGYLVDRFIPKLLEAGVDEKQVDRMLRGNPGRFLNVREG